MFYAKLNPKNKKNIFFFEAKDQKRIWFDCSGALTLPTRVIPILNEKLLMDTYQNHDANRMTPSALTGSIQS